MDATDYDVLISAADLLNAAAAFVRAAANDKKSVDEKKRLIVNAARNVRTAQERMHLIHDILS